MKLLFIGDVVGKEGRNALLEHLPSLKEEYQYDILVINGENAAHGKGITKKIYDFFINLGADCVTLGNHAFSKSETFTFINDVDKLIRPANMEPVDAGKPVHIINYQGYKICIFNLYGTIFMQFATENPYDCFKRLMKEYPCDIRIVDFHGEATSEKYAFLRAFKNDCQLIAGTHTHIQTADEQIYEGCGFICDVGMSGPFNSVLGRDNDEVIEPLKEEPTVSIAITEPMPIIIPNIVRNVRILFAFRLAKAITILSIILVMFVSSFFYNHAVR